MPGMNKIRISHTETHKLLMPLKKILFDIARYQWYSIFSGCAAETCDARSRWSSMRGLRSIIEFVKVGVCPKLWGKPYFISSFIYFLPNSLYQKLDFISVFSCSVTLNFASKPDNLFLYTLIFLSSNCICSLNCLLVSIT